MYDVRMNARSLAQTVCRPKRNHPTAD